MSWAIKMVEKGIENKYADSDHITGQVLKELSMSGSGTCWIHCEEHCERNHYISHWGHCDHIDGHIVKELNMCPLGDIVIPSLDTF